MNTNPEDNPDERDAERLEVLDRVAERIPELKVNRHEIEWLTLPAPDGHEALVVDGGGLDGGDGYFISIDGDNLTVIGPTAPIAPGYIGAMVIRPDGSRHLAGVTPDPAAAEQDS